MQLLFVCATKMYVIENDTSQGCSQGLLPQMCPNGAQEHPTNQRYPLDTYCPKYQEHHGTLSEQVQDIWQDQEVSTRP